MKNDLLVKRLNMISNSYFWPSYYISKKHSTERLNIKTAAKDDLILKVRELAKKKLDNSMREDIKPSKSASLQNKNLKTLPLSLKKHSVKKDFFTEKHIKVLRVVPNDKIISRTARKNIKGLLICDTSYNEKSRSKIKQCLTSSIEIQTSPIVSEFI